MSPSEARVSTQPLEMVTFTVSEIPGSTYQWQSGGVDLATMSGKIAGATTRMLTVSNIVEADEGNYTCIVTTSFGLNVTSQSANLFVCKYTV